MDSQRAKDILRHLVKDEDYGMAALGKLSVEEVIEVVSILLPTCIDQANEAQNENDAFYFGKIKGMAYMVAVDKLKHAERLWVLYDENTGYPYIVGDDMIVVYDYSGQDAVIKPLVEKGYKVSLFEQSQESFTNEIGHMYRNGYKGIRFVNGKGASMYASREDFYQFDNFFDEEYVTNPALSASLIKFCQEYRRIGDFDKDMRILSELEKELIFNIKHSELMVPCTKIETDDEVEFLLPPVNIAKDLKIEDEGAEVIALPVFTDGFELDKCFPGVIENVLYNFEQLKESCEELGAKGFVINYMGSKYYVDDEMMKKL